MPQAPTGRPVRTISEPVLRVLQRIRPFDDASRRALSAFGENFDPTEIRSIAVRRFGDPEIVSSGVQYCFRLQDGDRVEIRGPADCSSCVRVDLETGVVRKMQLDVDPWGCMARDADWLDRIHSGIAPQLLGRVSDWFEVTYEGERVNIYNLPVDWREQAEFVLRQLVAANCAHNDIHAGNIVVADGRIRLIDFGWATGIDEPIPAHWPEHMGHHHRIDVHQFDDRHALFKTLGDIERLANSAPA